MSLTDYTYFLSGRTVIYSLDGTGNAELANQIDVQQYIDDTEEDVLTRLLGEELYTAFTDGLAESVVDVRWTSLKNQLVNITKKRSPIVNFVSHRYSQDHQTLQTGGESVKYTSQDSTPFVNVQMVCDIYNKGVKGFKKVYDWLVLNSTDYPEWEDTGFEFSYINPFDI